MPVRTVVPRRSMPAAYGFADVALARILNASISEIHWKRYHTMEIVALLKKRKASIPDALLPGESPFPQKFRPL